MTTLWLAAVPVVCGFAALLLYLRKMRQERSDLRRQLAEVTQQGVLVALELQKWHRNPGGGLSDHLSSGLRARRAGDVAGVEDREELLEEIRLLLGELGVEAGRMQSLKIERHELIAIVDRAEELLGRVFEMLNR